MKQNVLTQHLPLTKQMLITVTETQTNNMHSVCKQNAKFHLTKSIHVNA